MKTEERNNIRKIRERLLGSNAKINNAVERLFYDCDHKDKRDEPHLERFKDGKFICSNCNKIINFNTLTAQKVEEAINIVDAMCDAIKLSINKNNPKDAKLLEKVCKAQFRNKKCILPAYNAIMQNRQNKKNHRYDNSSGKTYWISNRNRG